MGVMVWRVFIYRGNGDLVMVDNTINATRYTEVLEESILPFMESEHTR